jgi:hypothetical protein
VNAHAVFLGLGIFKRHRLAANTTKQVSDKSSHIIHLFVEEALVRLAGPTVLADNGCGYISTRKYMVSTVIHSPLWTIPATHARSL